LALILENTPLSAFLFLHGRYCVCDSIQALGVDYRILIKICGFNEILISTLLASGTIFGRLCFLLRAIKFYQISAIFLKIFDRILFF